MLITQKASVLVMRTKAKLRCTTYYCIQSYAPPVTAGFRLGLLRASPSRIRLCILPVSAWFDLRLRRDLHLLQYLCRSLTIAGSLGLSPQGYCLHLRLFLFVGIIIGNLGRIVKTGGENNTVRYKKRTASPHRKQFFFTIQYRTSHSTPYLRYMVTIT